MSEAVRVVRTIPLVVGLAASTAAGQEECAAEKGELQAAEGVLEECVVIGIGGCEEEQKRKAAAVAAVERCRGGGAAGASPAGGKAEGSGGFGTIDERLYGIEPADGGRGGAGGAQSGRDGVGEAVEGATPAASWSGGKVAVVVEGLSGIEQEAVVLAARGAFPREALIDAGAVRGARAFLGVSTLDDAAAEKLRADLRADRLLVLFVKPNGASRYLALRAFDAAGSTQQFAEATNKTMAAEVKRMIAELPPAGSRAAAGSASASGSGPATVSGSGVGPGTSTAPEWSSESSPWGPPQGGRSGSAPTWGGAAGSGAVTTPTGPPGARPMPYVDVDAFGGTKGLATGDWAPLASQTEFGVLSTVGGARWPAHVAVDLFQSSADAKVDGVPVRARTTEICVGARRIFEMPVVRPHVGVGVARVDVANAAEFEDGTERANGSGTGAWVSAGAFLRLGRFANLGFVARWSSASARIQGGDVAAGGLHAGVTLGFGAGSAASPARRTQDDGARDSGFRPWGAPR